MITNNYKNILIKFGIWFGVGVFLMFYGITHSLALTYTNVAELRDITQQLVSTNYGSSPFTNPINSGYAFNEVLQVDYIISNYNFTANTNYQLESHLTNQQLDNANYYSVQGLNGESCLISYQNSIFQDAYPRWAFQCPHNTNTITITIKNSSNQYLWTGTGIFNWTTALLKSSDTSLSGGDDSTDAIINNNNQNTQDIINNNNQNTQDLQNTINDNFNTCRDSVNLFNPTLSVNGTNIVVANSTVSLIDDEFNFIASGNDLYFGQVLSQGGSYSNNRGYLMSINEHTKLYFLVTNKNFTSNFFTFYDDNMVSLGYYSKYMSSGSIDVPNGAKYFTFRFGYAPATIGATYKTKVMISYEPINEFEAYGEEICTNKLDETKDAINNLDNTLKDDSVDENGIADAFDDFNSFLDDNSTITQLITLPITLYTAILNNLNGTCQPFNLGQLYGEDLILPCINISQYLGNALWSMIDIIISGFAVYAISKKMIKVFNNFSSLREGDVIDD